MQSLNGKRKMNFAWPIVAKKQENKFKAKLHTSRLVTCFCWQTPPRVQPSLVPDATVSRPRRIRLSPQTHPSLAPDASVSRPRRIRLSPQTRTRLGLCVPTGIGNGFDIRIITRKRPVHQELVADTASTLP